MDRIFPTNNCILFVLAHFLSQLLLKVETITPQGNVHPTRIVLAIIANIGTS